MFCAFCVNPIQSYSFQYVVIKKIALCESQTLKAEWQNCLDKNYIFQTTHFNHTMIFFKLGKTCRHYKTRIEENIKKNNKSHISKHLHSTAKCFESYNSLCFKLIDKANSKLVVCIGGGTSSIRQNE